MRDDGGAVISIGSSGSGGGGCGPFFIWKWRRRRTRISLCVRWRQLGECRVHRERAAGYASYRASRTAQKEFLLASLAPIWKITESQLRFFARRRRDINNNKSIFWSVAAAPRSDCWLYIYYYEQAVDLLTAGRTCALNGGLLFYSSWLQNAERSGLY